MHIVQNLKYNFTHKENLHLLQIIDYLPLMQHKHTRTQIYNQKMYLSRNIKHRLFLTHYRAQTFSSKVQLYLLNYNPS